jgi:Glycosyltransferase WbsX
VPENDAWHGRGFTEWTVVARSNPLFPGHRQPELPGELGFYDLRVPETRYRQADLARSHGISGFLYYHYWFGGRRMLSRPFQEVLESGKPDFPFALCWTNESWYRRWQGSIDEMLMEQVFSEEDDVEHILWLIDCFKDPRYIRVDGRPLLAIYRPHHLPEPKRTVELWRAECEKAGIEPPWLIGFETGEDIVNPASFGFDASAEFVPHHLPNLVEKKPFRFGSERSHRMYEYDDVADAYLGRPSVEWLRYPCVPTAWDNSPRRQTGEALILHGSTPQRYGRWLREALVLQAQEEGKGIVFVNAWNEWAEGAHLEPDAYWGRSYLEMTRDTLVELFDGDLLASPDSAERQHPMPTPTEDLYFDLYDQFTKLQNVSSGYLSYADRRIRELKKYYEAKLGWQKFEGELVADLNEWLAEQLQLQAERMRQLHIPDVPDTDWLHVRPPTANPEEDGEGDQGDDEEPGGNNPAIGEHGEVASENGDEGHSKRDEEGGLAAIVEESEAFRQAELQAKARTKEAERRRLQEEDERRRDEGFDDPPGVRAYQWLMDVDGE